MGVTEILYGFVHLVAIFDLMRCTNGVQIYEKRKELEN